MKTTVSSLLWKLSEVFSSFFPELILPAVGSLSVSLLLPLPWLCCRRQYRCASSLAFLFPTLIPPSLSPSIGLWKKMQSLGLTQREREREKWEKGHCGRKASRARLIAKITAREVKRQISTLWPYFFNLRTYTVTDCSSSVTAHFVSRSALTRYIYNVRWVPDKKANKWSKVLPNWLPTEDTEKERTKERCKEAQRERHVMSCCDDLHWSAILSCVTKTKWVGKHCQYN